MVTRNGRRLALLTSLVLLAVLVSLVFWSERSDGEAVIPSDVIETTIPRVKIRVKRACYAATPSATYIGLEIERVSKPWVMLRDKLTGESFPGIVMLFIRLEAFGELLACGDGAKCSVHGGFRIEGVGPNFGPLRSVVLARRETPGLYLWLTFELDHGLVSLKKIVPGPEPTVLESMLGLAASRRDPVLRDWLSDVQALRTGESSLPDPTR